MRRSRGNERPERTAPKAGKAALFKKIPSVLEACREIERITPLSCLTIFKKYMRRAVREDEAWWAENGDDAHQAYFIYRYLIELGEIQAEEETPLMLVPQNDVRFQCALKIVCSACGPETGRIEIRMIEGSIPAGRLNALGFVKEKDAFVRSVEDDCAPITDLAADTASELLSAGAAVCVYSEELRNMILSGNYKKERRYRVYAPENELELAFTYPWDPVLHRHLFRAGAKWNGRYMALPVTKSENVLDLIRLYSFYVEPGAAKRMEIWQKAERNRVIFQSRGGADPSEDDPLRRFMDRPVEVISDLVDEQ